MATLVNDGVSIWFEDAAAEGVPVLLSHGYSATGDMWRGQLGPLVEAGYRPIVWDMRGHGRSDSPEDQSLYSEEATVDDMTAILDECGVDTAVIGGLSLGGYMSLAFHLAHPDRTDALLLFDTGPGYKKDEARDGWNANAERTAKRFEERGLDGLGRGAEVRVSSHRSAEGLARAARGMLAQRDARVIESLPDIKVPTLVLLGENDTPYIAGSDYMVAKIPNATKVVIPEAGHSSNIDQPAAFNRATLEFLSGLKL
jgi:pimeloyl-ACP methyl ester carboxylesterase